MRTLRVSPTALHPFFEDSVVPTKNVRCFPNNKPWVSKDIKILLNRKNRAHMARDRKELRAVQKDLKKTEKGYELLQGEDRGQEETQ